MKHGQNYGVRVERVLAWSDITIVNSGIESTMDVPSVRTRTANLSGADPDIDSA
jgi:hypothetical protein